MGRRWEEKHDTPLTGEQLAEFRKTLGGKEHFALDHEYRKAHEACTLKHAVPPAWYIQRLVTVWKAMRRRAGIRSK